MLKKKLEFSKDIFASKNVVYFDVMYVYVREMCERDVCVIRKVSDEYGINHSTVIESTSHGFIRPTEHNCTAEP